MEIFIIYIKMDLALNNLQRLIRHKTNQTKPNQTKHNTVSNWRSFLVSGITHLFPHNELVHLPYIAVATNTRVD